MQWLDFIWLHDTDDGYSFYFDIDDNWTIAYDGEDITDLLYQRHSVLDLSAHKEIMPSMLLMPSYPLEFWFLYDEVALAISGLTRETADPNHEILSTIHHRWIPVFESEVAYYAYQYLKGEDKDLYGLIGVHLSEDTNDGFFRFNLSALALKGGELGFLFGIHDGKFFIHGNVFDFKDTLKQVGDGLKNFRLRELKKISKAKK